MGGDDNCGWSPAGERAGDWSELGAGAGAAGRKTDMRDGVEGGPEPGYVSIGVYSPSLPSSLKAIKPSSEDAFAVI